MMSHSPARTALIVIDVQRAFDQWEAAGKRRNNPQAVARIVDLLDAFRERGAPVFHIRHQGTHPNSSFLPDGTGYPVKDEARERAGEPVIVKQVNSAFIGTDLEARLRAANHQRLDISGAETRLQIRADEGAVHPFDDDRLARAFARLVLDGIAGPIGKK